MAMGTNSRLDCESRKCQILAAVRKIFSRKGLAGTTTRELAKEAGVSEALLYKHYPSKEALYQAMLTSRSSEFEEELERITSLEPSTSTLVNLIHFRVAKLIRFSKGPDMGILIRFYLRSLTEDGAFARVAHEQKITRFLDKAEECIKVSIKSGDMADSPIPPRRRA